MKKRFILSVNKSTIDQQQEFIKFLENNDLQYWHWITDMWLVIDKKGVQTTTTLRDSLKDFFGGEYNLVIDLESDFWAGFGPNGENRNMFTWLQENWKR